LDAYLAEPIANRADGIAFERLRQLNLVILDR